MDVVIFDLNGTLVDSERAHWMAYREVLTEYGINFEFQEFTEDWTRHGHGLDFTLTKHKRTDLLNITNALKEQKDALFREKIPERIELMDGADRVVASLASAFTLVVDSTSSKHDVIKILRLFHIEDFLAMTTSGDMSWDIDKYGKSSKAARFKYISDALRVPPNNCLIVGDAEKDVKAAKSVGMAVVIVPTETTKDNDLSLADLILPSLTALTSEVAQNVLQGNVKSLASNP